MKYVFLMIGTLSLLLLNFSGVLKNERSTNEISSNPFAVVELFTSEGCYSCPPTDKLLSKIIDDAREKDRRVFALAFHVDYWDRLGWKDAFSRKEFSDRQRDYAQIFKSNTIYTPQMIVNGMKEFVGSEPKTVYKSINYALEKSPYTEVELSTAFNRDKDVITVYYKLSKVSENASP